MEEGSKGAQTTRVQEQTTYNVMKKPIKTTCIFEMEKFCDFRLEKRQLSSSAVMFA